MEIRKQMHEKIKVFEQNTHSKEMYSSQRVLYSELLMECLHSKGALQALPSFVSASYESDVHQKQAHLAL